jgi:hypothetical protein
VAFKKNKHNILQRFMRSSVASLDAEFHNLFVKYCVLKNMPRSISNTNVKEPLILNDIVCDSIGRTLVGVEGTTYLSGSSLPGSLTPEIREILICPGIDCGVDSSHSPVVYSKVGEGGSSITSPYDNTTDLFCQHGSRISLASNEAFLYIPARSVPSV